MKPSKISGSSTNSNPFNFNCEFTSQGLELSSNCDNTSYALTDTNGSILLKGCFDVTFTLEQAQLMKGHFVLVMFKDDVKKDFPVHLK